MASQTSLNLNISTAVLLSTTEKKAEFDLTWFISFTSERFLLNNCILVVQAQTTPHMIKDL